MILSFIVEKQKLTIKVSFGNKSIFEKINQNQRSILLKFCVYVRCPGEITPPLELTRGGIKYSSENFTPLGGTNILGKYRRG